MTNSNTEVENVLNKYTIAKLSKDENDINKIFDFGDDISVIREPDSSWLENWLKIYRTSSELESIKRQFSSFLENAITRYNNRHIEDVEMTKDRDKLYNILFRCREMIGVMGLTYETTNKLKDFIGLSASDRQFIANYKVEMRRPAFFKRNLGGFAKMTDTNFYYIAYIMNAVPEFGMLTSEQMEDRIRLITFLQEVEGQKKDSELKKIIYFSVLPEINWDNQSLYKFNFIAAIEKARRVEEAYRTWYSKYSSKKDLYI